VHATYPNTATFPIKICGSTHARAAAPADEVYKPMHERTKDALLDQIACEREHEPVDRPRIKNVIDIFINVSMNSLDKYREDFEAHLLAAVHEHYQSKAAEWIQSDSCAEYLKKAEACIAAEEERAAAYLHPDSKKPVISATQKELLENVQARLRAIPVATSTRVTAHLCVPVESSLIASVFGSAQHAVQQHVRVLRVSSERREWCRCN
jgi:Cullin family